MKKYAKTYIVDDDAIAIFGLKRSLIAADFNSDLSVFENGLDALENIAALVNEKSTLPDLIFIDLNMPVMDGWDFLAEYVKLHPAEKTMPTIFIMTSSVDVKDLEKAETYNLEGNYLVKPVSVAVLTKILA